MSFSLEGQKTRWILLLLLFKQKRFVLVHTIERFNLLFSGILALGVPVLYSSGRNERQGNDIHIMAKRGRTKKTH